VRYDSGAGSTYVERDFTGTGVTAFDAATGATLDSPLTEVAITDARGTLGVLTSIKGTIDCGNQMPGSSALTVSGSTPKGAVSGGLSPVNVECTSSTTYGSAVSVDGIIQVGSTPYFAIVYISPNSFTFFAAGDAYYRTRARRWPHSRHPAPTSTVTPWSRIPPPARRRRRSTSAETSPAGQLSPAGLLAWRVTSEGQRRRWPARPETVGGRIIRRQSVGY